MARSYIRTLLPLDEYARIMAIPGWLFNQVVHPSRVQRGECDGIWLQTGWSGDPNRIAGRDELAQAIATAEEMIARTCSFWPAPKWFSAEPHQFPRAKRGYRTDYPIFSTRWGYLIAGGRETWEQLGDDIAIVYSDPDGDGVDEWATITYDTGDENFNVCEAEVVFPGQNPSLGEWRIRPLEITISAGVLTIQGFRWMFVNPNVWLNNDEVALGSANFLTVVDIYRHYNDTTATQAEYRWLADPCSSTSVCTRVCDDACIQVYDERLGQFQAPVADYSAGSWQSGVWPLCTDPHDIQVWYYAGYRDYEALSCDHMGRALKEAIVRLANIFLPEAPCGCGLTRERWTEDRKEQDIDNINVALAKTAFGTTAVGAVFAYSVIARLPPLGKGG